MNTPMIPMLLALLVGLFFGGFIMAAVALGSMRDDAWEAMMKRSMTELQCGLWLDGRMPEFWTDDREGTADVVFRGALADAVYTAVTGRVHGAPIDTADGELASLFRTALMLVPGIDRAVFTALERLGPNAYPNPKDSGCIPVYPVLCVDS